MFNIFKSNKVKDINKLNEIRSGFMKMLIPKQYEYDKVKTLDHEASYCNNKADIKAQAQCLYDIIENFYHKIINNNNKYPKYFSYECVSKIYDTKKPKHNYINADYQCHSELNDGSLMIRHMHNEKNKSIYSSIVIPAGRWVVETKSVYTEEIEYCKEKLETIKAYIQDLKNILEKK